MKSTSLTTSESNEEEVELADSKLGEKECDEDMTYLFHESVSHELKNIIFEHRNASTVNRIISKSYTEPVVDNFYSPPEIEV